GPPANTWATVTKNGRIQKDSKTPPKEKTKKPATTKSMIVQRTGDEKNETLNLLHLRNSINRDLIEAKAPESLQVTGISWNQKGNLMLYTRDGFQNEDIDLHQAVITTAVAKADPTPLFVNKQETWHKLTIHGVSLETYPDTATGMMDLKRELEYCNTNLQIATEPRYMTHPSKREGKFHSSVVISLTNKAMYNTLSKKGIKIFGATHETGTIPKAYRPISLLNCLGKISETIIATRLAYLSEKHKLLHRWQIGVKGGTPKRSSAQS
ncbi:hypothetical protein Q9L58_010905, partial [Maublancomyces gigas]